MSNVAQLADRNHAFAATDARQNMPALPFIPFLNLYIVTCLDCRVDPAEILGKLAKIAPVTAIGASGRA